MTSTDQPRCAPLPGSVWRDRDTRRSTLAEPRYVVVLSAGDGYIDVQTCDKEGRPLPKAMICTAGVERFRGRFTPVKP